MSAYLNPREFLRLGGITLIALGIIGFIAWYASGMAANKLFYLDNGENVAHLVLGIVGLGLAYGMASQTSLLRLVTIVVGLVSLFFGVYGFMVAGNPAPNTFGVANLENPLDNLLHLVVALWALASAFGKPAMAKR